MRPSRSEGLGNAFLEAMAVGLPVVGTPVGGIVDFLRDGETGALVLPRHPSDLAMRLERLLADPALRQQLAAAGQQLVRERYDWEKLARDMGELLEQTVRETKKLK